MRPGGYPNDPASIVKLYDERDDLLVRLADSTRATEASMNNEQRRNPPSFPVFQADGSVQRYRYGSNYPVKDASGGWIQSEAYDAIARKAEFFEAENASRAAMLRRYHDIIGYNNDDGFHAKPDAETILRARMEYAERLKAVLEHVSHINGFREFNDYLPTVRAALKSDAVPLSDDAAENPSLRAARDRRTDTLAEGGTPSELNGVGTETREFKLRICKTCGDRWTDGGAECPACLSVNSQGVDRG
jgi:hypothetical protein